MPASALPTELVQIAFTVPDLEAACREWAERVGAGPFLIRQHMQVNANHDGEPAIYDHSAAFGQWGPLMLELVELHECSPAPLNDAFRHSAPNAVNHYAYFVEDLAASSAALQEQGFPLMMELVSSSGMQVHFLDGRSTIGGLIEIYEGSEHIRAHYAKVAELARDWDGSDPVRYM
ncbi:MAG: VOC family protein [Actinobacteria bacterium]|nr:VOC family protein [Actinomycetota bacterium]